MLPVSSYIATPINFVVVHAYIDKENSNVHAKRKGKITKAPGQFAYNYLMLVKMLRIIIIAKMKKSRSEKSEVLEEEYRHIE